MVSSLMGRSRRPGWPDGGDGRDQTLPPWLSFLCRSAGTLHQMMLPSCFQAGTVALSILIFLTLPDDPDAFGDACASKET